MRSLLHAHTRTCYGAAFNVTLPSTLSTSTSGAADISSRGKVADAKIGSALDSDADYEDSKTAHKRNLDFSDDKDDKQYESKIEPSSGQCITWSSDCSVRYSLQTLKMLLHSHRINTRIALHNCIALPFYLNHSYDFISFFQVLGYFC